MIGYICNFWHIVYFQLNLPFERLMAKGKAKR